MKTPFKVPFWLSTTVMVVVLLYWTLSGWFLPVRWISTGEVFWRKFTYVYSAYSGGGDSFNVAVNKMGLVCMILFFAFVSVVGALRWLTAELSRIERCVFRILSALLGLFPLSAAAVAFVMIGRLTLDMGITPRRLFGLGCAVGAVVVVSVCLWLFLRFWNKPGAEPLATGNAVVRAPVLPGSLAPRA